MFVFILRGGLGVECWGTNVMLQLRSPYLRPDRSAASLPRGQHVFSITVHVCENECKVRDIIEHL